MDVVVIGSGLIGLSVARELARRGAAVTVVDARAPARAASWAAAGMLAPNTEAVPHGPLYDLCSRSLALYPDFVAELREESGIDANLLLGGIAITAFDARAASELRERSAALTGAGIAHRLLDAREARSREPALSQRVQSALVIEREGQIDNRLLGRALHAACLAAGVRVDAGLGDVSLEADERRVRGVRTSRGFLTAPVIVNATGAWAARIAGLPAGARPPVFPVKGQMVALTMPSPLVRSVVWAPGAYLVPRRDGRLLVGATVENAGFDERVTSGAIAGLLEAAIAAMPELDALEIAETWAGLRPGSPDGLPFIGPTVLEGLFDASGHARNGVLLAPVTACAVADLIGGKPVAAEVAAASPLRRATAPLPA